MKREIEFEYGFQTDSGIIKKVYSLSEIPNIKHKCDVWDVFPICYVSQYTGLKDKNGTKIFEGDYDQNFDVVLWCENSVGWQLKTYNHPTKEVIECNCYSCQGHYDIKDDIDIFIIVGNIHE